MSGACRFSRLRVVVGILGAWLVGVAALAPAAANSVLQWNETIMKAIDANGQSNTVSSRTLAMTQAAVHDALNAISRRYDAYYFEGQGEPGASQDAAVAAAAHTVIVGMVNGFGTPAQKIATYALLDQAYGSAIAAVADGPARNRGVAIGRAAGAAMLALRRDDGALRDAPYVPGVGAGKWRPHPNPVPANPPIANPELARGYQPAMVPGWGTVTPFTLLSASQFWLPGPPAWRARPTLATSTR